MEDISCLKSDTRDTEQNDGQISLQLNPVQLTLGHELDVIVHHLFDCLPRKSCFKQTFMHVE